MTWVERVSPIAVGSRVAYSAAFLRSTGQMTGDIPAARGMVKELKVISPDTTIAVVDWSDENIPARVNIRNLAVVGTRGMAAE